MKTTKLSELSYDELLKEEKKRKAIFIFYSILWGIMILASLYTTIKKGTTAITFLPVSFLPIFLFFWKSQKEVCNEIKSRKSN